MRPSRGEGQGEQERPHKGQKGAEKLGRGEQDKVVRNLVEAAFQEDMSADYVFAAEILTQGQKVAIGFGKWRFGVLDSCFGGDGVMKV